MRDIKFDLIYGITLDVSTYFRKQFTLDQMVGQDHFDVIADSPLLRDYRILYKRQFTGLTDKNGVEIYEGDIVSFGFEQKGRGVIMFNCNVYSGIPGFHVCEKNGYSVEHYYGISPSNAHAFDEDELSTVIGNIHENPDILD